MINQWFAVLPVMLLGACGASFPSDGAPSPFDGMWTGSLPATGQGCEGLSVAGEVRNGYLIVDIKQRGVTIGEVWGPIDPGGRLVADIGRSGVSVGSADVTFTGDKASGVWSNEFCDGRVAIRRR